MAVLMSLAALRFASDVFVPVVLGVMLSYALTPWVNLLVRLRGRDRDRRPARRRLLRRVHGGPQGRAPDVTGHPAAIAVGRADR